MKNFAFLIIVCETVFLTFSQNIFTNAQGLCHGASRCLRLSECALLYDLIHRSCIGAERFRSLTCGYVGSEPMLCCPVGGLNSIVPLDKREYQYNNDLKTDENKVCGAQKIRGLSGYNGLGSQPWVARIGFQNIQTRETKYPCGGSILSNRVILTAAHCALAKTDNYKLSTVLVGEWSSNTDIDCGSEFCSLPPQQMPISHVVVHPGYASDNTYRNDLALIVLRENINFTVTAQPLCIYENEGVLIGQHATLVGWGKLAGQQATPPVQQSLTLPVVPMSKCQSVYGTTVPLGQENEQLCVGGTTEGQDACAGFGGAPLIAKHKAYGTYHQVGMLSFGAEKCGAEGIPSVYTNIQKYARWIRENTPLLY